MTEDNPAVAFKQDGVFWSKRDHAAMLAKFNHLTPEELGVFTRLFDKMMISGGRLPDDNRMLAQIVGLGGGKVGAKRFARLRPQLGLKGLGDGTVTHPAVEDALVEVAQRRWSARRAAENRWEKTENTTAKLLENNEPPHAH